MDVRVGDTVVIYKAGEIIPKVDRVVSELRQPSSRKFNFQAELKSQHPNHSFERLPGLVAYRLVNQQRQTLPQLVAAISHYSSRGAMTIDGLGEETAQRLVDGGLVKSLADIYQLNPQAVAQLEGLGDKSAQQLVAAINSSKQPTLARFLFGLGIDHIGSTTANLLANHYRSLQKLAQTSVDELTAIEGIGPKVAESIANWFDQPNNKKLLAKFKEFGVCPQIAPARSGPSPLAGIKIVVSGKMESWGRTEVKETIQQAGGQAQSSLSSQTDYLVIGSKPSPSKVAKAKALQIKIIDEDGLAKLLAD